MSSHHEKYLPTPLLRSARLIAVALTMLGHVDSSMAATIASVGSGRWQDISTWDNGVPQAGDDVVIDAGDTVTLEITTAEINSIVIRGTNAGTPAELRLKAGAVLRVAESVEVEHGQAVPGVFWFELDASPVPQVRAMASGVTLDGTFTGGAGVLSGSEDASSFTVEQGATVTFENSVLTNNTTVIVNGGSLTIYAALTNNGTLTVDSGDLTLSGATTNNEKIVANGGTIDFDAAVTNNETVRAESGAITFNGAVTTSGEIWAKGGDITFAGTISGGSTGKFKVSKAASEMVFDMTAAVCLSPGADFTLSAGLMHFRQTVRTRKDLTFTGGKIVVSAARVFAAGLLACP